MVSSPQAFQTLGIKQTEKDKWQINFKSIQLGMYKKVQSHAILDENKSKIEKFTYWSFYNITTILL